MAILDEPVEMDALPDSDVIPAGQYKLRIDAVDYADENGEVFTDKNGVKYLKFGYTVVEGEYTNRKVFENYVPRTGSSKLKKILRACAFPDPKLSDTDSLVGLELTAVVKIEKSDTYGEQNRIATYVVPGEKGQPAVAGGATKTRRK